MCQPQHQSRGSSAHPHPCVLTCLRSRHPRPLSRHHMGWWSGVQSSLERGLGALGVALVLLVGGLTAALPAQSQTPTDWDAAREQVTRTELQGLLERLETQAASSAYSSRMRAHARESMQLIERRLREGDFQTGDRVVLDVQGEPEMSDTLTVRAGRVVDVPVAGRVSLEGVLRSELQEAMESHISNYVRNPVVQTQALIRLSLIGEVASPGFYVVPADIPVTDALMLAGGPTGAANLPQLRVERGSARIWEGEAMEMAVIQGRTLDQMNIQAGDRIVVPAGGGERDTMQTVTMVTTVVGSLGTVIFLLTQLF